MVYLFLIFAITWLGFFAYLFYLHRREQDLEREVALLREALARREEAPLPGADEGRGGIQ